MNWKLSEIRSIGYVDGGVVMEFLNVSNPDVIFIDYNSVSKLHPSMLKLIEYKIIYIEEDYI